MKAKYNRNEHKFAWKEKKQTHFSSFQKLMEETSLVREPIKSDFETIKENQLFYKQFN